MGRDAEAATAFTYTRTMRLIAGLELDGSVGPGTRSALGQATVSPTALLGALQTAFGLGAPAVSPAEQAVWLMARLGKTEGYWSASFAVDGWGTAARLIADRDALSMHGWCGEAVSARWDALWAVTRGMPGGRSDRWAAVRAAAGTRAIDLAEIVLVDPRPQWPGAITRVLAALEAHGVAVREVTPAADPDQGPATDLRRARSLHFVPVADGSLQLVRAQGASAAAEDVAAWLSEHAATERGGLASTIIVAPDATLDAALQRAGLPTTGAGSAARGARAAALQLLPLSLALLWSPADPQAALDLLSLPASPVPRGLARRLVGALRRWPALGSDAWNQALAEHDYGSDPQVAARRKNEVDALLTADVPRDRQAVPVQVLRRRIERLLAWTRPRIHAPDAVDAPAWRAAWVQQDTLLRLVGAVEHAQIDTPLLARLVEAATQVAQGAAPFAARAGIASVDSPGAVIRPVDTIVWWGFTRDAAPPVRGLSLTAAERGALANNGITIPSAGDRAMWTAQRWRRPLSLARKRLLLLAPQTSSPGDALHPHPLWDEIVAAMPEADRSQLAASLHTPRPGLQPSAQASRRVVAPLALPEYRADWHVPPGALPPRAVESPSGLGTLVGCSLRWALRYPLRVSDDDASYRLGVGPRELGSLAHEVLAEVLLERPDSVPAAEAKASAIFDALGPSRVAALFMPGSDAEREDTRLIIVRSAGAIVEWLATHGLSVELAEGKLQRAFEGRSIEGRVDLLASTPPVVVDFKWGGRVKRRDEIRQGTAYQLASYAYAAAKEGGAMPQYAYFIVREQLMIGLDGGPFDAGTTVRGPTPSQTWDRFLRACRLRLDEVAAGSLVSPGALPKAIENPAVEGDSIVLPAGCEYCSYDGLCGRAFVEGGA